MGVVSPTVDEVDARVLAIAEPTAAAVAADDESIRLDDGSHRLRLVNLFDSLDDPGQRALGMWAHQRCMRRYDQDTSIERWLLRVASARRLG